VLVRVRFKGGANDSTDAMASMANGVTRLPWPPDTFSGGALGLQSWGSEHLVQEVSHDLMRNKLFMRNPRGCFAEVAQFLICQVEPARYCLSDGPRIERIKKKSIFR